jgi:DNA-binding PadR family transcriptional regulator
MGLVWRLKQSQLYALLRRLEEEGHVTASLEPQDSRPPRRVFQLTQAGCDAFLDWVQSPVLHGREMRLHFLAKLYFARREGPEVAARLIEQQRTTCQSWLAAHQANSDAAPDDHAYQWLVHRFRTAQIEAILTWLDECQQMASAVAFMS